MYTSTAVHLSFFPLSSSSRKCMPEKTGLDSHVDRPLFFFFYYYYSLCSPVLAAPEAFVPESYTFVPSFVPPSSVFILQNCFSFFSSRRPSFSSVPYGRQSTFFRYSQLRYTPCVGDSGSTGVHTTCLRPSFANTHGDTHTMKPNSRIVDRTIRERSFELTDRSFDRGNC